MSGFITLPSVAIDVPATFNRELNCGRVRFRVFSLLPRAGDTATNRPLTLLPVY